MHTIKALIATILSILLFNCTGIDEPAKYAVVYGISDYPYPGLELLYSTDDAVSTAQLLEQHGYNVILRTNADVTIDNLIKDFDFVTAKITDIDLFLFYFSGHGLCAGTIQEHCDSIVKDDYFSFLLHGELKNLSLCSYINENTVTKEKLSQLFASVPHGLKAGLIDACYSGALRGKQPVADYTPDDYDGFEIEYPNTVEIINDAVHKFKTLKNNGSRIGYTLLASSGNKEVSWDGFFSHGVFTYFFLKSAEDGDLNNDGFITILESYSYIYAACQKYWNTSGQDAEWNFLPTITGGAEDIILFR